jgi:hypothetical protein
LLSCANYLLLCASPSAGVSVHQEVSGMSLSLLK